MLRLSESVKNVLFFELFSDITFVIQPYGSGSSMMVGISLSSQLFFTFIILLPTSIVCHMSEDIERVVDKKIPTTHDS